MRNHPVLAGWVLAASLLSAACIGQPPTHYYTIGHPVAPAVAARTDGAVLLVGRVDAPEALEDGRIQYRVGANEVGAYEFQRWTERPALMVRNLLIETLRASGKYRQVQEASSAAAGDYLVRGRLYEFSEIDDPGIQTRVSLLLELVDRKTALVIWSRRLNRDEPVAAKTMPEVVKSLDHNLQQVVAEAVTGIDSALSNTR